MRLPRGAWRAEVDLRVRELHSRLLAAEATADAQPDKASDHEQNAGGPPSNPVADEGGSSPVPAAPVPAGAGGAATQTHVQIHVPAPAVARAAEDGNAPKMAQRAQAPAPPEPGVQRLRAKTSAGLLTIDVHETAPQPPPPLPAGVRKARVETIEAAIARASESIRGGSLLERAAEWWTGNAITIGWESVHGAEAELVDIESEADVRASLPHLVAWLQQAMPAGEPRKRYEGELDDYANATKPLDRTTVRQIYKDVVRSNNESKASLRAFRNLLTVVTAALALLLAVLAAWHAVNPRFVSLCGAGTGGSGSATTCLSGSSSRGQDVLAVELLGAIGGLLSLAVAFGGTETPPARYNVRPQQAALKVAAGAATGLIGVLIVQSGVIVSAATQTSSEALFLVYAAVFGFSQQLFTKFVDKRADALLGESEEKKEKKGAGGASGAKA